MTWEGKVGTGAGVAVVTGGAVYGARGAARRPILAFVGVPVVALVVAYTADPPGRQQGFVRSYGRARKVRELVERSQRTAFRCNPAETGPEGSEQELTSEPWLRGVGDRHRQVTMACAVVRSSRVRFVCGTP